MSRNWTRIFWKVFSKRILARQFPRLLRTPANQLLCDLADFWKIQEIRRKLVGDVKLWGLTLGTRVALAQIALAAS